MSINRGMGTEDVVIYTMEFYSAIKKEGNICNNMDGPRDYHSKLVKDKHHMISLTCTS